MDKSYIKKIEEHFGGVKRCTRVSSWRQVYKIDFDNYSLRLDVLNSCDETTRLHQLCLDKGLTCFASIKKNIKVKNRCLKISEWILGRTYDELFNSNLLTEEMLIKMGESMALVNNISEGGLFLHNDDVTYCNVILDENNNFIMFDLDRLFLMENPSAALVKTLLKRIARKNMMDAFLEGYKRHRDITETVSLCELRNWKWRK